jgi:hypothetical protein
VIHIPPPPSPRGSNHHGSSRSNKFGGTSQFVASGFHIPVGGQPQVGGHNLVYGKSMPSLQSQPWNLPFQENQQPFLGQHPQVNSFVPPNLGKSYPGSMNPTWGQNFQSNAPFQGILPNHPTLVSYSTQNPPSGLYNYLQTAYGPIGIPTGLPPQKY